MGTTIPTFEEHRTDFQQFLLYTQYKWNEHQDLATYRKDLECDKLGLMAKCALRYFIDCFASKTVRKRVFDNKRKRMKISDILTVSDEAFACVIVELGFDLWSKIGRKEIEVGKTTRNRPRFRVSYEPNGGKISERRSIYDTKTCAEYYNKAYGEVESARKLTASAQFEVEYFQTYKNTVSTRKRHRSLNTADVVEDYYIAVQGMNKKRTYV